MINHGYLPVCLKKHCKINLLLPNLITTKLTHFFTKQITDNQIKIIVYFLALLLKLLVNLLQFCNDVSGDTGFAQVQPCLVSLVHWDHWDMSCSCPVLALTLTVHGRAQVTLTRWSRSNFIPGQTGNTWGKIFLSMMNISTLPLPTIASTPTAC